MPDLADAWEHEADLCRDELLGFARDVITRPHRESTQAGSEWVLSALRQEARAILRRAGVPVPRTDSEQKRHDAEEYRRRPAPPLRPGPMDESEERWDQVRG